MLEYYDDILFYLVCVEDSEICYMVFGYCEMYIIKYVGELDFLCVKCLLEVVNGVNLDIIYVYSEWGLDVWGVMFVKILGVFMVCIRWIDNFEIYFLFYKYK